MCVGVRVGGWVGGGGNDGEGQRKEEEKGGSVGE